MILSKDLVSITIAFLLSFFLFLADSYAEDPPLQVDNDGRVNINSVLRLTPRATPPASPSAGDIYFTTGNELLIYANGKWNGILAASATHGTKHITNTGSGTWTVPAGIYSITVSMVAGGGGGGSCVQTGQGEYAGGGIGGKGGVVLNSVISVAPGQQFSYSVGNGGNASSSGGSSTFGALTATGGQGGQNGSSSGNGANGANGTPQQGTYPGGTSYGTGGTSGQCGNTGLPGTAGAIYIQY